MATAGPESSSEKPLRLWPGVAGAIIVVFARFVIAPFVPGGGLIGLLVGATGAALILLWWLFFSRAPWLERIGAVLLIALAAVMTRPFVHPSIGGGAGGGMLFALLLPATVPPFLVAGAILSRRSSRGVRWATMAVAILLGSGVWVLARTDGIKGEAYPQLAWRWTPTAEERLLTAARDETLPSPSAPTAPKPADSSAARDATPATANPPIPAGDAGPPNTGKPPVAAPAVAPILWSGFRGRERDAVLDGVRISSDWNAAKPMQVWRRSVGPGWSSFAVAGELIFTQEQRGDHELISAYRLSTGEPVWRHQDAARFYEPAGGAGPRGTPTVHDGRVYAMGATGIVNALDARTGAGIWTRNAERDTGARRPDWGFAASPLVVGDVLVAAASGRLAAYDLTSGTPRWTQKTNGGGYSSPHLATLAGVPQILLMNGGGITSVGLDGSILWANHSEEGIGIVQPRVLEDGSVLAAPGEVLRGLGVRRLAVSRAPDGTWKVEERWTSRGLKPYFNDFVVHKGHAYGFDGTILSAINLETGERVWKGGRYGAGQMLLLPQQDLLLVVSEEGDLVLVAASPDQHTEIAKFKAIEGKTWNHPVLVGDVLLVRNGEEMAAFRLPR
jgi:outer membrane protein assembly factor BamB